MAKPVKVWLPAFMRFISLIRITSKECPEPVPIVPYEGQKRFLRELVAGLNGDVHHFTVLKSRQLGISTILLALDIFWLYMHPGLQGALICDTAQNLEIMRGTITEMLESLPPRYRVPIRSHNRTGLVLANGSRLQYMSAGKNKNSGLGRSRALNYVHATECSSWGDQKGLDSLLHALAEQNPNRLYVFESTALGYNLFHDMWEEAKSDARQRAIFIGWWSKDTQQIARDDEDFERWWGEQPYLTEEEAKTAKIVEAEYGWRITEEQWAWYRRKSFNAKDEHSLLEEQPSTEHEAFQATGNSFFSLKKITADMDFLSHNQVAYTGYKYTLGKRFLQMRMEETKIPDEVDLKVWENPVEGAKYVLGVDPAYGRDEDKDRSTIEVWRCFADKLVQVAEYSTPMPETRHVAWVMAHLAGCYRDCMINLEITGPGGETLLELNNLKLQMQHDVGQRELVASLNPNWALDQARWYLYHRPDSMGPGYAYAWKCLDLSTPLPTISGWTTMGDVQPGDFLLDESGKPTRVLGCSPVQEGKRCFRVTFDDDSSIVADEEHLWPVYFPARTGGADRIVKTVDLKPGKHAIRRPPALDLPSAYLPIDPYVLGVWLGDGCSTSGTFFASRTDHPAMAANLRACGVELGEPYFQRENLAATTIMGLKVVLRWIGVLGDKHIPQAYLRGSRDQRLALLQGLMDTDGTVGRRANGSAQLSFSTSNKRLADQFCELLRTLGIRPQVTVRDRRLKYRGENVSCATAYQIGFTTADPVFRLPRKRVTQAEGSRPARTRPHRIVSVEGVDSVPVRCVLVDSPSHLFLAGTSMVPTHNTSFENKQRICYRMREFYDLDELIPRSMFLLDEMRTFVQDGGKLAASGSNKDDRVMATALACIAYAEWIKPGMIVLGQTYEAEMKKQAERNRPNLAVIDWIVPNFLENQRRARESREHEDHMLRLLGDS